MNVVPFVPIHNFSTSLILLSTQDFLHSESTQSDLNLLLPSRQEHEPKKSVSLEVPFTKSDIFVWKRLSGDDDNGVMNLELVIFLSLSNPSIINWCKVLAICTDKKQLEEEVQVSPSLSSIRFSSVRFSSIRFSSIR